MGTWSVSVIMSAFKRMNTPRPNSMIFQDYLDGIFILLSLILFFSLIVRNILHPNLKKKIFNSLEMFDEKCATEHSKSKCNFLSLVRYSSAYIVCPLLFLANLKAALYWTNLHLFTVIALPQYIALFYEMYMTAFLWEIVIVIESRYNYVKFILRNNLKRYSMSHSIFILHINQLKTLIAILHEVMKQVNLLFGFVIVIVFSHMITMFLMTFTQMFLVTSIDWKILDFVVIPSLVLVSHTIQII